MRELTLAHLSDLHFGGGRGVQEAASALCAGLIAEEVDHVVVTGDVTHRGRREELAAFQRTFAPLLETGKMTVVPGNHDRVGEDAGRAFMGGERVSVVPAPGLFLVCVDSTGPHNRNYVKSHGDLCRRVLQAIDS